MKTVVGGLPVTWYERPPGIVDREVCVNPSKMGGNGSGEIPGPFCPFRMPEKFVEGTEPKTDDRNFYTSCGIRLVAPFSDWQDDYNKWAANAVSGRHSYNRFSWRICGFAPAPSPSPSGSPGASPRPNNTPKPTSTPRPSRRP
jgi:hypothetical protein